MPSQRRPIPPESDTSTATQKILNALRGLRFGSAEIIVHEGRIVQIERKEKMRLNTPCPGTADREEADR